MGKKLLLAMLLVCLAPLALADVCEPQVMATDTAGMIAQVPTIDAALQACPVAIRSFGVIPKDGSIEVQIARTDGTSTSVMVDLVEGKASGMRVGADTCSVRMLLSEENLDSILQSTDQASTITYLMSRKQIRVQGCTFFRKIGIGIANPFARMVLKRTLPTPAPTWEVASQNGQRVCDFYNAPTKKLVTCAAARNADAFCVNVMGSLKAKALKCEENGQVLCGVPCEDTRASAVLMNRCTFDINRARGTQAAPLEFCEGIVVAPPTSSLKEPGEVCKHGGECRTGNCVGVGQGPPWTYQCSCDPFRSVTSGC